MKNNYIVSNDFYIKDNLYSFLLYFDYFLSQGLPLFKYVRNAYIRKMTYIFLRMIIILLHISKLYKFRYKILTLNENALVIFNGSGRKGSVTKLIVSNGKLKIQKKVFNKKIYLKEKKFYDTYKNNLSLIQLPKHKFLKNNLIEIEFLKFKTFQKLIVDGTFDFKTSIKHLNTIKDEIKKFYGNKYKLIHGDLWSSNIFIKRNTYYLIDFTESCKNEPNYDLYVLLYSILLYHRIINENDSTNYSYEKKSIAKMIEININDIKKIENQFINYRNRRWPSYTI